MNAPPPLFTRGNALLELTLARLRLFFREPGAVFWTFGFPLLLSIALGAAFRNRPPEPVSVATASSGLQRTLSLDPGIRAQLLGRSVLRPRDGPVAVIDQRRVRDPVGHQTLLERPVPLAALALLRAVGMELRAPAAGEHAPVPLDESGEVGERLRRERPDREVGHAGNLTRIADVPRPVAGAVPGRRARSRGRGARPGVPRA